MGSGVCLTSNNNKAMTFVCYEPILFLYDVAIVWFSMTKIEGEMRNWSKSNDETKKCGRSSF